MKIYGIIFKILSVNKLIKCKAGIYCTYFMQCIIVLFSFLYQKMKFCCLVIMTSIAELSWPNGTGVEHIGTA